MSDWWSRKLNPQDNRPGLRVPSSYPEPVRHVQQAPQPPQHQPVQAPPQPQDDPNREVTMGEAMRTWKGGEAHRKEGHLSCPECGSATGYTQYSAGGATTVNGNRPRSHCFECGYNGHFMQGLETSWA
jgi:hypothetical protein